MDKCYNSTAYLWGMGSVMKIEELDGSMLSYVHTLCQLYANSSTHCDTALTTCISEKWSRDQYNQGLNYNCLCSCNAAKRSLLLIIIFITIF